MDHCQKSQPISVDVFEEDNDNGESTCESRALIYRNRALIHIVYFQRKKTKEEEEEEEEKQPTIDDWSEFKSENLDMSRLSHAWNWEDGEDSDQQGVDELNKKGDTKEGPTDWIMLLSKPGSKPTVALG